MLNRFLESWILVVLCLAALAVGPTVEGTIYPVTTDTKIGHMVPAGKIATRILSGEFEKVRDCSFEDIEWRYSVGGRDVVAQVNFEEGVKVRGEGLHTFGPWYVDIPMDQVKERSRVFAYHRCHWLWLTKTRFYP